MSESRRCQLQALLNEAWGKVDRKPELHIVGNERAETLPETFRNATATLSDFAGRWVTGVATASEIEDAAVTVAGLQRLLRDWDADTLQR